MRSGEGRLYADLVEVERLLPKARVSKCKYKIEENIAILKHNKQQTRRDMSYKVVEVANMIFFDNNSGARGIC